MTSGLQTHSNELTNHRREEFMGKISSGIALFPAAPVAFRNSDVEHEYRQDSDFYYLTASKSRTQWRCSPRINPNTNLFCLFNPKTANARSGPVGEQGQKAQRE